MRDYSNAHFEIRFVQQINQILPDAYDKIYEIENFSTSIGLRILTVLVEYACEPQNTALIVLARNQIKKIPIQWLYDHFLEVAVINKYLEDEWEYRRYLELVADVLPKLLKWAIDKGITSTNEEIREAAEDFIQL